MESKTEGTMQKSIENWVENWCQKIVYILLGVIILKNKQCGINRFSRLGESFHISVPKQYVNQIEEAKLSLQLLSTTFSFSH